MAECDLLEKALGILLESEADVLFELGNFNKAAKSYKRLIDSGFSGQEIYYKLALSYSKAGRHKEAVSILEELLKKESILLNENRGR